MSAGFLSIGLHKIALIKAILTCHVDLIVSDIDTGKFPLHMQCQLKTCTLYMHCSMSATLLRLFLDSRGP